MIKKLVQILLILIWVNTYVVFAQEVSQSEDITIKSNYNMDQCIYTALENNPDIKSSLFNTDIFKSRIGQAKAAYFPQIDFDTSYSRLNPSVNNDALDRDNNDFAIGVSLNQLIYDFGKTSASVKLNRLNYLSSEEDLKDKLRDVIFQVKQYFYLVLLKIRNKEVLEESVKLYEQTLRQSKALYEKGFRSKIDVVTAEVNLNNAKIDLIRANNELELAYANLNDSMGVPGISPYTLDGKLQYKDYSIDFDEVLDTAYEYRPDLKSIDYLKLSAEKSKSYAKRDYLPVLSASSSYRARGNFPIDPGWSVGAFMTLPVFNGLLTHNKVKEARATILKREAESKFLKQKIYLELKEIYLNFKEVKEKIPLTELVVEQAKQRYDLAKKRYEIGVGDFIELKDAEIELKNARLSYFNALYDYNITIVNLEKAIGKDIPDIANIF